MNRKWLIGRTITDVDMGVSNRRTTSGRLAHDPTITLDNGAKLVFHVEETVDNEYGVDISYIKPRKET